MTCIDSIAFFVSLHVVRETVIYRLSHQYSWMEFLLLSYTVACLGCVVQVTCSWRVTITQLFSNKFLVTEI